MNKRTRKKWLKKQGLYINTKEMMNLDCNIAKYILPRLKMYKKLTIAYPGYDEANTPEKWDIVVSNPPFSIKDKVLDRLYSFSKPFAVLLPLNSLQGKSRYKYFKQGVQILSFDARVCYHDKNHMNVVVKGSPFATAYFCKDLLPKDLIVEKLNVYERPLIN